jgi:hypothetical protein
MVCDEIKEVGLSVSCRDGKFEQVPSSTPASPIAQQHLLQITITTAIVGAVGRLTHGNAVKLADLNI